MMTPTVNAIMLFNLSSVDWCSNGMAEFDLRTVPEHRTTRQLWALKDLEEGWHFGEGRKVPWPSILAGLQIHRTALMNGFRETDSFPGVDGEVRVTMYRGTDYYEATIETDGRITFVHEVDDTRKVYSEGLSIHDATRAIVNAGRGGSCKQFTFFTLGTTTLGLK